MTLTELAARLGCALHGDGAVEIHSVAGIEQAGPGQITFLANPKYAPKAKATRASAILAREPVAGVATLVSANPYLDFARTLAFFYQPPKPPPGIHPLAFVAQTASIGPNASIGPFACVGEHVRIGANCVLYPHVTIYEGVEIGDDFQAHSHVAIREFCRIGNRVTLQNGVVIGADGFGLAMDGGRWVKVPQVGRVVIGDDVEIGANSTVDRGALDDTVIEEGVKLDNQIQVGHNVRIGAHTAIAACAGIAGSARIGRYCRIGGASGIAGHLTIADHVEISTYTLVTKSIDKPGVYTGAYVFEPHRQWRRNAAQLRHLAELAERVRELERQGRKTGRRKP